MIYFLILSFKCKLEIFTFPVVSTHDNDTYNLQRHFFTVNSVMIFVNKICYQTTVMCSKTTSTTTT